MQLHHEKVADARSPSIKLHRKKKFLHILTPALEQLPAQLSLVQL
jgi:hypothetical protein